MDILNFISWIRGGRRVTTVDPDKTLVPIGIKDSRRDDGYLSAAITVTDLANYICGEPCTAPVVLTAPLYGTTNREFNFAPAISCDGGPIINFGFLGSAPNDSWVNIIDDANETLSWIGTWELGEDQIILTMDCNFYTFLQTLCSGEITLFATAP
jgi:hypothetical protein